MATEQEFNRVWSIKWLHNILADLFFKILNYILKNRVCKTSKTSIQEYSVLPFKEEHLTKIPEYNFVKQLWHLSIRGLSKSLFDKS